MNTISNEVLEKLSVRYRLLAKIHDGSESQAWEESALIVEELLALRKERERAEPVAYMIGGHYLMHANDPKVDNYSSAVPLYTATPAPVEHEDDSEIKWRELALQFDGHRMQAICFLKQILNELPEAEFSSARDFLKSGPLPGEEVLRNRISALAPPAPVVPDDVIAALRKVAKIRLDFNDFDGDRRGMADCLGEAEEALIELVNRRAAVLNQAQPMAETDTTSQQFESLASVKQPSSNLATTGNASRDSDDNSSPDSQTTIKQSDGWIPCSKRMPVEKDIVLVVDDGYFVCEAQYREGDFFSTARGNNEFFETICRDVEFWQPLPEPPCK